MTTMARTRPTTRRALFLTLAVAMLVTLVSPTASQAVEVEGLAYMCVESAGQ